MTYAVSAVMTARWQYVDTERADARTAFAVEAVASAGLYVVILRT